MAQAVLDGNSYDLYNFSIPGKSGADTRYIRETKETLAESSRTVTTTHKKRFKFDLTYLTASQIAAIVVSFDKNTFSFQPLPYDSTVYTVKVISDGTVIPRVNTSNVSDQTGIVLEVA